MLQTLACKTAAAWLAAVALISVAGCVRPAGVIFPVPVRPLVWPAPPETARIQYVGQLSTSADLKAAVPFHEAFTRALFGGGPVYSMLSPSAVCTDGADRVFVADAGAQAVHVFNLKTRKYARWVPAAPLAFAQPVGVAWDPSGRLFVADSVNACVYVFDTVGAYRGAIGSGQLKRPSGLSFDATKNRLLVVDTGNHCLVSFSPEGSVLEKIGGRGSVAGQFNFPTNLVAGHDQVFVSDSLNFRVQHLDNALKPLSVIGKKGDMPGSFSAPKGVALDSDGHLYVVDAQFESIQIFDREAQLLLTFGEEGHGPGQFWLPAGIFIDRNLIWVTDSFNRRIQVFEYIPEKRQ